MTTVGTLSLRVCRRALFRILLFAVGYHGTNCYHPLETVPQQAAILRHTLPFLGLVDPDIKMHQIKSTDIVRLTKPDVGVWQGCIAFGQGRERHAICARHTQYAWQNGGMEECSTIRLHRILYEPFKRPS